MTLPLTYVLVSSWFSDPSKRFPRIQTDYRPKNAELVDAQKSKDRRKTRRLGLTLVVVIGWAVMLYMAYLIRFVEAPSIQRIWNPYDILDIAEVWDPPAVRFARSFWSLGLLTSVILRSPQPRSRSSRTTRGFPSSSTPTRSSPTPPRMRPSSL